MSSEPNDLELVRKAAEQLSEHFDSVQILATRHESGKEDGTINVNYGIGNWFARYGQAYEWLVKCDERIKMDVRDKDIPGE